jgi:hypothetical protein
MRKREQSWVGSRSRSEKEGMGADEVEESSWERLDWKERRMGGRRFELLE